MTTCEFMPYNSVIVSKNDYVLTEGVTLVLTKGRAYWADKLEIAGDVIYRDSAKDCHTIPRALFITSNLTGSDSLTAARVVPD